MADPELRRAFLFGSEVVRRGAAAIAEWRPTSDEPSGAVWLPTSAGPILAGPTSAGCSGANLKGPTQLADHGGPTSPEVDLSGGPTSWGQPRGRFSGQYTYVCAWLATSVRMPTAAHRLGQNLSVGGKPPFDAGPTSGWRLDLSEADLIVGPTSATCGFQRFQLEDGWPTSPELGADLSGANLSFGPTSGITAPTSATQEYWSGTTFARCDLSEIAVSAGPRNSFAGMKPPAVSGLIRCS